MVYYIIENSILKQDINIIYFSDNKNDINTFIIRHMSGMNCELIEMGKSISAELYKKSEGMYYQYNENGDSIHMYERIGTYIPFMNSYQLTHTLYIKKFVKHQQDKEIERKRRSIFGQLSKFKFGGRKNSLKKVDGGRDGGGNRDGGIAIDFIKELKNNVLFNSRRACIAGETRIKTIETIEPIEPIENNETNVNSDDKGEVSKVREDSSIVEIVVKDTEKENDIKIYKSVLIEKGENGDNDMKIDSSDNVDKIDNYITILPGSYTDDVDDINNIKDNANYSDNDAYLDEWSD